jgi:hypothetical protein
MSLTNIAILEVESGERFSVICILGVKVLILFCLFRGSKTREELASRRRCSSKMVGNDTSSDAIELLPLLPSRI